MRPESQIEQAVILCGGLGTRLRPVVGDQPKSLVIVHGRPFLDWLLLLLRQKGIRRAVLATGYQASTVRKHFVTATPAIEIVFSEEAEPLGTAGAIRHASRKVDASPILVLNGDSYCRFELDRLAAFHASTGAQATIWLAPAAEGDRYGSVELGTGGRIIAFREKQAGGGGPFNAGVYLLERTVIDAIAEGERVSLESQVFPSLVGRGLYGLVGETAFVDIGTPESLATADDLLASEFDRLEARR